MIFSKVFYVLQNKYCFQISVIDYLQTFDRGKKNEVIAKKLLKNIDTKKLSAVPPDQYGPRFINFMNNVVFQNKFGQEEKTDLIVGIEDEIK